jgi:hypothetical protein
MMNIDLMKTPLAAFAQYYWQRLRNVNLRRLNFAIAAANISIPAPIGTARGPRA